ncbi:hypothetical protein FHG87_021923 [Trinorchestia longiramus]|nr:hypothetical protein FHG87_021923 [Trinorchestia longiramus]
MFGMNVMAWNGGDLEKLEVLQNRVGRLALGAPKWTAAEALRGDLGWSLFSERMVKAVLNYKVRIERMENKRMAVGKSKKTGSCSMIECRICKMWVDLESCKGLTEMSQSERSKLVFDCIWWMKE